jgi:L-Ala-D/L-Glu epimerase
MKFVSASIHSIALPFTQAFQHSLSTRASSDSFIVSLTTDSGVTGYGEGVARPYVTGETHQQSIEYIKTKLLPVIAALDVQNCSGPADCLCALRRISERLPVAGEDGILAWNAAKCAVELAVIDCVLRAHTLSIGALLPPKRSELTYSVVIGIFDQKTTRQVAETCRAYGITQIKIKIGKGDDLARVRVVRETVGSGVSIRVDANCAFNAESTLRLIDALLPFGIVAIEQPIPRDELSQLAAVTARSPVPIIVDESLITIEDADELIASNACNMFNVRLSKNGGVFSTLEIVSRAEKAGLGIQLGCQVGETAILSAAGRHAAAYLPRLDFLEGSYGSLLLEADISQVPVSFSHGGNAQLLTGPGLGVEICQDRLKSCTKEIARIELGT